MNEREDPQALDTLSNRAIEYIREVLQTGACVLPNGAVVTPKSGEFIHLLTYLAGRKARMPKLVHTVEDFTPKESV